MIDQANPSRAHRIARRAAAVWLAAACIAGPLAAQQTGQQNPGGNPNEPLVPGTNLTGQLPNTLQPARPQGVGDSEDLIAPKWTTDPALPPFLGFPVFPTRLSGYGGYPGAPEPGLLPFVPKPPAPQEAPGWPSWLRLQSKAPLPFAPDLGLLVRNHDRVWWRSANDDVFVPLYFHDKLHSCGIGDEVEVRQEGDFELLLYTSTRLVAQGPTRLRITNLDEFNVELDLQRITRLYIAASQRTHQIKLPDGSLLVLPPGPAPDAPPSSTPAPLPTMPFLTMAPAAPTPSSGPLMVLIQRADEPGWFGGRATVWNSGPRDIIWRHAFGETKIEPQHRITLFLEPPRGSIPMAVATDQVEIERAGSTMTCRTAGGGTLSWCGVHWDLPAGATLRLDPLQGNPFAPLSADATKSP